jgi:L-iditol 2-dehydrogenase
MTESVKTAVMVAPGRIEVQEFPYPSVEEGALLIRVELSGICGTDKRLFTGHTTQYAGTAAERTAPFPLIPGHENVGIIAEVGGSQRGSRDFNGYPLRVGDRVVMCPDVVCGRCWYCRNTFGYPLCERVRGYGTGISATEPPHLFGGWAEYLYVLPQAFVYKVPEGISLEVAVLTELFTVTAALDMAKEVSSLPSRGFGTGDTVVIQGVGPLGLCCLIKAKLSGAGEIIVTDHSAYRLSMAREFGADYALSLSETTEEDRRELVLERTGGRGADVVIECAGEPDALREGLELLRRGGTYIELGSFVASGTVEVDLHRHLCAKNILLLGFSNHPFTGYERSLKLMERHAEQIPFDRMITHRFPLVEAEEAMRKALELETMKVVIDPTQCQRVRR